jgi:hypothetical protein
MRLEKIMPKITNEELRDELEKKIIEEQGEFYYHIWISYFNDIRENISSARTDILRDFLSKSTVVNSLDFSFDMPYNNDHGHIDLEQAKTIATALKNPLITSLNLSYNTIALEAIEVIAAALKTNTSITDLILNRILYISPDINITDELKKIQLIFKALETNTSIKHLDLSVNSWNTETTNAIAIFLTINTSIEHLDLSANNIGLEEIELLVEALKINTSIRNLNLSDNDIGLEEIELLVKLLNINTSINDLNLQDNPMNEKAIKLLFKAFKKNTSINSIYLGDGFHFNEVINNELDSLLQTNKIITGAIIIGEYNNIKDGQPKTLTENKFFLKNAAEKLTTNAILDKDELLTLKSHAKNDDNWLKKHIFYNEKDLKNYPNTLQEYVNKLTFKNSPQIEKALHNFNPIDKAPGFLYFVAEYLGIQDIISLNQIFHPKLYLLNKQFHSRTLKAINEHANYLSSHNDPINFLPQEFFLATHIEASNVITSYPLNFENGGQNSFFNTISSSFLLPSQFSIQCAQTIVDSIEFAKSPSFENFRNLIIDANYLCGIYYGSNVYHFVVIAANAFEKALQGELIQATKDIATSAVIFSTSQFLMQYNVITNIAYGATTLFKINELIEKIHYVVCDDSNNYIDVTGGGANIDQISGKF